MVKEKKDLSVISFLNNTDMNNNLANCSNNDADEINSNHQKTKETICLDTSVKDEIKTITNKLESVKQNHEQELEKKVTKEDKKLYVNNFLYYNFHKINRYIPVEEIHLEDESSDSEYDDDFYDYQ